MSDNEEKILGFFSSCEHEYDESEEEQRYRDEQEQLFTYYLWGEGGLADKLGPLKHVEYGKDLVRILFQFNLFPSEFSLEHMEGMEKYRAKEKAIGIPLFVTKENFFSKPEVERRKFLHDSMIMKLDLLSEVVKQKKLDTDIEKLKQDIQAALQDFLTKK